MFISKANQRRLELIDYLHLRFHPTSYEELMDYLKQDRRVIYDDLIHLKNHSPEITIWMGNDGVLLRLPLSLRIDHYRRKFYRESTAYKLIELTLLEPNLQRTDILDRLEISQTTLYRLVHQLNENHLKESHLRLSLSPFGLIGQEEEIRIFYKNLISQTYTVLEWPFTTISYRSLEIFMQEAGKTFDFELDFSSQNIWATLLAINIIRFRNGHLLPIPVGEKIDSFFQLLMDDKHKRFHHVFEETITFPFNLTSLAQIIFPFIKEEYLMVQFDVQSRKTMTVKHSDLHQTIHHKVEDYYQKIGFDCSVSEQLVLDLETCLLINDRNIINSYINQGRDPFIHTIKKLFPQAYHEANKLLTDLFELVCGESSPLLIKELLYIFFIRAEGLLGFLQKETPKIKTLVVSDFDGSHHDFLVKWLADRFEPIMEIHAYEKDHLNYESLASSSCQLIISNFFIPPIEGKQIICVEEYPTISNHHGILATLTQLNCYNQNR